MLVTFQFDITKSGVSSCPFTGYRPAAFPLTVKLDSTFEGL